MADESQSATTLTASHRTAEAQTVNPQTANALTATVVVCAWTADRWDELCAAVDAAAAQAAVHGSEVVVVIDHQEMLHARARRELTGPVVRVIANQHHQGLSGARNTGIEAAAGDVVVFLDDDATPRPGWLAALLAPYADPTVLGVGGVAVPRWGGPGGRPPCLPAGADAPGEFDWVIGCTWAGQPSTAAAVRNLLGCTMSLRRSVFARVGGFAESLGRVGSVPLGCEETELCIRATAPDPRSRVVLAPAAVVDHLVTAPRQTWRYLWSRCRAEGVSKAAVARLTSAEAALATERTYLREVVPRALVREARRLPRQPATGFAGVIAIVSGVAITATAYLWGRVRRVALPGESAPRLQVAESGVRLVT